LKEFKKALDNIRIPDSLKDVDNIKDLTQSRDFKRIFDGVFDRVRIQARVQIPKRPPTPKLKIIGKPKPPKKPKRLRIPRLKLLKKSKNTRAGFIVRIKQGKSVVAFTKDLLPKKRATNFMRKRLDDTIQASGEIVRRGVTKIRDVKKTILGRKFTKRKGKNPLVRINVEKVKFRLDRPREKSISQFIKQLRKRNATKKKKPVKRKSKKK